MSYIAAENPSQEKDRPAEQAKVCIS